MKLLIIRFSSFGDIVQASAVPKAFLEAYPTAQVDWLTRGEFAPFLSHQPSIHAVVPFAPDLGLFGLISLSLRLSRHSYTHVYDAHSNLRSGVVSTILRLARLFQRGQPRLQFVRRSKERWKRFLFFRFRLPTLPAPFRGGDSFHRPLRGWGLAGHVPAGPQLSFEGLDLPNWLVAELLKFKQSAKPIVALAASAAWPVKRWPVAHWQRLLTEMNNVSFFLLGGPGDDFLGELEEIDRERILNLAGRLTLEQSAALLSHCDLVVANDTGLLHVADQLERSTLALIGPTAFGYPSHATSLALERPLDCQPCSKDGRRGCTNSVYQRCMVELTPELVIREVRRQLNLPVATS